MAWGEGLTATTTSWFKDVAALAKRNNDAAIDEAA
jgi:hypothetical protein